MIEMYTKFPCPFCSLAENLLLGKGYEFTEIPVNTQKVAQEMYDRTKGKTVPQIIINGHSIGGFNEMQTLDRAGKLDKLLSQGSHG